MAKANAKTGTTAKKVTAKKKVTAAKKGTTKKKETAFDMRLNAVKAELARMEAVKADVAKAKIIQTLRGKLALPIADAEDYSKPEAFRKEVKAAVTAIKAAYQKITGGKKTAPAGTKSTGGDRAKAAEAAKKAMLDVLGDGKEHTSKELEAASAKSIITANKYRSALLDEKKIVKVTKGIYKKA